MATAAQPDAVAPVANPRTWLLILGGALLSGLLVAACYRPANLHGLAWIALVPWLLVLPRISPARAWIGGTIVGLAFYRLGLDWTYGLLGPFATLLIVGLAVWMGLAFRVARMLMVRFGPAAMLWAVPLTFVGQEVLRCEALPRSRFAFLALGYSQSHSPWVAQIASLGGVYSLSLVLATFNAALAYAILGRQRQAWVPFAAVTAATLLLVLIAQPASYDASPGMPVACIQGEDEPLQVYKDMVLEALAADPKPRLIVLPEHTVDTGAYDTHPLLEWLVRTAQQHEVCIAVGADVAAPPEADCPFDNVVVLYGPDGREIGRQAKSVPLPFFDDGNPAQEQRVFETPFGRIGPYVCYDAHFTDVPRRLVRAGAQMLIGPVMDPQRWPAQERWQHADMAPLRSIELRRCQVRAASTGVSQIIDATGRVTAARTKDEGAGVLFGEVYLVDDRTPFVRGGYLLAPMIGLPFVATIVLLTLADWWGKVTRRPCGEDSRGDDQPTEALARQVRR